MENQGFPRICIEIDGMKFLKKKSKKEKLKKTKKLLKDIDSEPSNWVKGYWEWKNKNEEV